MLAKRSMYFFINFKWLKNHPFSLPVVSLLLGCSSIKAVVVILAGEGKEDSGCFAEETSGGAEVLVTKVTELVMDNDYGNSRVNFGNTDLLALLSRYFLCLTVWPEKGR